MSLAIKRARTKLLGICATFFVTFGSPIHAVGGVVAPESILPVGPSVTTIAGNGLAGTADGLATGPVFSEPVAVAADHAGSLLIVDEAAQRVRRLSRGFVSTFAGTGPQQDRYGRVEGGFQDGPALLARFNDPTGIAVGADDAVYVADQLNHCVRKIEHGIVSTFAGDHNRPGSLDGNGATASFQRPMAIAVSDEGSIYVADFGVGLREITKDGTVTTIALPDAGHRHFTGVAVAGSGDELTVVTVEDNGLYFSVMPGVKGSARVFNGAEGGAFPRFSAITAVDDHEFIATDLKQNSIRQLRLPDPPLVTQPSVEVIAGAPITEGQNSGGFTNGPVDLAKFYTPLGIAVVGHVVIICDSGNRRIRAMPVPDTRGPIGSDIAQLQSDPGAYKVLLLGSSGTFWATTWDMSIPGLLERGLKKDRLAIGLTRPPHVFVARLDQANLLAQVDYATTFAASSQLKLVVMLLESDAFGTVPSSTTAPRDAATIKALRDLKVTLLAHGTAFFVSVRADPFSASLIDDILDRDELAIAPFSEARFQALKLEYTSILQAAGVDYAVDFDNYIHYTSQPDHLPLWSFEDSHENANGRRFAAANLLHELEVLHPWKATAQRPKLP